MANTQRFSVALLGCGAVVQDFYLPVLKDLSPCLDVRLCVDVVAENSRATADALGALAVTGGQEQLWQAPATDGVIISIPNRLHALAIAACLTNGRHVFCEKPVTTTSAEADDVARLLATTELTLSVNLLRRCFPASRAIRHVVHSGVLGRLQQIEVTEGGRGGWQSRSGFQFSRDSSGGGVTLDRGSHIFDLLVHWLGPPRLVSYVDDAAGGTESTSITELQWPDGPRAIVKASKYEPWPHAVTIVGSRGTARWTPSEPGFARMTLESVDDGETCEAVVMPQGSSHDSTVRDALASILRQWIGATRGENANPTPFSEVRTSIDIISQCYETRGPLELEWLAFEE